MRGSSPKYLRLSRIIEDQIIAGAWPDRRMPSLRGIAEEHGVSMVTAARAIQVLRDKGLIGKVDRSGCFLADPAQQGERPKWGVCLRVTQGDWQRLSSGISRSGFDAVARQRPVEFVELVGVEDAHSLLDMSKLVRKAMDEGIQGVLFLPSRSSDALCAQDEWFVQACRQSGLPMVFLDRNLRGHGRTLEHDLVSVDDLDGGLRSTEHLLDIGRQRIAMVVASPCSSHDERIAGYLQVLRWRAAPGQTFACDPVILELPALESSKASDRWLADQVLHRGIDGVCCFQDSVAIGLIMELFTRGFVVPRDVAVVGFDDLPIGNLFTIGVTTYKYPAEAVIKHALQLLQTRLREPETPPVHVRIPGRLLVRESTARELPTTDHSPREDAALKG